MSLINYEVLCKEAILRGELPKHTIKKLKDGSTRMRFDRIEIFYDDQDKELSLRFYYKDQALSGITQKICANGLTNLIDTETRGSIPFEVT